MQEAKSVITSCPPQAAGRKSLTFSYLLRNPSFALTTSLNSIIKAFQNPVWAEQARQRLNQIKILSKTLIQPTS